jgi:adenosylcobinamide kinase/adenosylcobinamide-phosphate guanylyltransferase
MSKIILITGGVRSGKSKTLYDVVKHKYQQVTYIATSPYYDEEMEQRIEVHKNNRPQNWKVIEEEDNLTSVFGKIALDTEAVLIECVNTYVCNLILKENSHNYITNDIHQILNYLKTTSYDTYLVTNEVGMDVIPDNELARQCINTLSTVNNMIASRVDEVYMILQGIPIMLK